MKSGQAKILAIAMIGLAVVFPVSVWAGGELTDEDHDHPDGDKTSGPFGFVKDHRGSIIAEATVTVDIKNRGQIVTQTNVLGAYKIPTFGIEIKPEDVSISCKKDGYKQLRVTERPGMGDATGAFEIECVMQKL